MKKIRNLPATLLIAPLGAVALSAALAVSARAQAPTQAAPAANSSAKPVVVELFTAEGCSDCPPADAIAMKMEQQPLAGVDLIVIEEHVDYWNQYGWFDPFSSPDWTTRQVQYVGKVGSRQPYTPEMVIDGEAQFPGTDMKKAQAAVDTAMSSPETQVTITKDTSDPKGAADFKISVGQLEGNDPGDTPEVWIAVTEDGLHSSVNAGENSGHTLYHAAILRYLHKVGVAQGSGDAAFTGDARVKFNSKWNQKDLNIVAFVQDKKSLKIIGATQIKAAS